MLAGEVFLLQYRFLFRVNSLCTAYTGLLVLSILCRFLATFEDKRKENFDKGQAELERRRRMLQEQQQREMEERQRKEREEMERLERMRLVLHIWFEKRDKILVDWTFTQTDLKWKPRNKRSWRGNSRGSGSWKRRVRRRGDVSKSSEKQPESTSTSSFI